MAAEVKSLSAPTQDLLDLFGIPASSVPLVTTEQALRVTAVSCAIRTIAEAAASLGVMVKEVQADGTGPTGPTIP